MNKTTANAAQLAKCILLHTYSRTTAGSQLREKKQKIHSLFNNWLAKQNFWLKTE